MEHRRLQTLAVRKLRDAGRGNRSITITLGLPRRAGKDWLCPYGITGLGKRISKDVFGVDAIQAILLAMEAIRLDLEKTGRRLSWLGEDGETGFPRLVPTFFGAEFAARVNRIIDLEVSRLARALESKHRKAKNQQPKAQPAKAGIRKKRRRPSARS